MMRIAGASVLFATLVATGACSVGGGDDGGGGSGDVMGGSDDRTKLGITCSAAFTVTGTFTPGTPARPIDADTGAPLTGCWPVGTWTFTAGVAPTGNTCAAAPSVLPSYSFRLDRIEGTDGQGLVDNITNLTSVGSMHYHLSVSSTGQGCEANFEFGSADGKDYWDMKPTLLNPANAADPPTTKVTGGGDYDRYTSNGWPWSI